MTDAITNKTNISRLSEALQGRSLKQPKNQPELSKTPDKIGDRSNDAVRSSVDVRLTKPEPVTGSGRSVSEISSLVESGDYFKQTSIEAVAESVARDLF